MRERPPVALERGEMLDSEPLASSIAYLTIDVSEIETFISVKISRLAATEESTDSERARKPARAAETPCESTCRIPIHGAMWRR
jgi:hypothetical protein